MKTMILAFIGAITAALISMPAAAQVSLSSTPSSQYSATTTFDFDTTTPLFTGGGTIVSGNTNIYAQPVGSTGNYFALGPSNGGTVSSLFFGTDYALSSVSWIWGSLDGYNSIQFFGDNGALIGDVFTGDMITAPAIANGDRSNDVTNRTVTFNFARAAQQVRGFNLTSTQDAMELDNLSIEAAVPEPSTWALMMVGFVAIGAVTRRRARRSVAMA